MLLLLFTRKEDLVRDETFKLAKEESEADESRFGVKGVGEL